MIYGYTNETKPLIRDLLISLATITFGDFDFFGRIKVHKHLFPKLKNLRIADLLLKVKQLNIRINYFLCVFFVAYGDVFYSHVVVIYYYL